MTSILELRTEAGLTLRTPRGRRRIRPHSRVHGQSGFSLVELMVVFAIMTIALSMLSRTLTSASKLDPVSRERTLAAEAARNTVETMRGFDFATLYAHFNADPADDPGGAGTSRGKFFDVDGLTRAGERNRVGEIVFCDADGQIREDSPLPEFGLPRDLNGDGIVDRSDHTADCIIMPFKILVRWDGRSGPRKLELYGVFSNL